MPQRSAILFYGHRLNYARLHQASMRFANALRDLGVQPGERVMIALPNMPALVATFYGTLAAGGVAVLSNPLAALGQLQREAEEIAPVVLVTLRHFWDWLPVCVASAPSATMGPSVT